MEENMKECTQNCAEAQYQQEKEMADSNQKALELCQQEMAEWKEKYLRLSADFQNYKRRLEKEQLHFVRMIKADLLSKVLSIVDNFDRALERREEGDQCAFREGFELIRKDLYAFLEKQNVKEMDYYEEFNPEFHEAIMHVESDRHEPGQIVEVLLKGYLINDEVLRPAKVSIAK